MHIWGTVSSNLASSFTARADYCIKFLSFFSVFAFRHASLSLSNILPISLSPPRPLRFRRNSILFYRSPECKCARAPICLPNFIYLFLAFVADAELLLYPDGVQCASTATVATAIAAAATTIPKNQRGKNRDELEQMDFERFDLFT